MKKLILIILIAFLGCNEVVPPRIHDTNEIVNTIVADDSLNLKKDSGIMVCEDLIKINIYHPAKGKDGLNLPPEPPFNKVSINDLMNTKINGLPFFSSKDSLSLIDQNPELLKHKIINSTLEKINPTTKEKEISKRKTGQPYNYYEMTIPVFSADNTKAYIQLNHYCGGLCGSGTAIYLSKSNGKWKVIDKHEIWIS